MKNPWYGVEFDFQSCYTIEKFYFLIKKIKINTKKEKYLV